MGSYGNGHVLNAIWKVNGEAKGWGPHYTPTAADVGKTVVYTEEVLGKSGDRVNFTAAPVIIVASLNEAAPAPAGANRPRLRPRNRPRRRHRALPCRPSLAIRWPTKCR